jgi:hypothetical protein
MIPMGDEQENSPHPVLRCIMFLKSIPLAVPLATLLCAPLIMPIAFVFGVVLICP